MRMNTYKKNSKICGKEKIRMPILFTFKLYGLFMGVRRRPNESNIIKNMTKTLHNRLKIYLLTIKFNNDMSLVNLKSKINYSISISVELDVSIKPNKKYLIPKNELVSPFSSTSILNDMAIGSMVKSKFPKVYNVLCGKPGYMWNQYYTSIMRFSWLHPYFLIPNKYVDCVPALLEYFSGIDEICLFDIVCKFHVRKLDKTKYNSYMDMRFKLKKIFISKIIDLNQLKFDSSWRLHPYESYKLNNINYLELDHTFGERINPSTLLGFIGNGNIKAIIYIMEKINKDVLYKNMRNLKNHVLISHLADEDKNKILNILNKLENGLGFLYTGFGKVNEISYESNESDSLDIIYMDD